MSVKSGEVPQEKALELVDAARERLAAVMTDRTFVVPERPDTDRVNAWMVSATQRHWMQHGLV